MQVNLNDLAIFVEIADKGSFIQAAQSLGLPKTTVSRRIHSLEHSLGFALFYRTTRQVKLTAEGQSYLEACAPALKSLEAAHHHLKSEQIAPRGRLRVVSSFVIGNDLLGPIWGGFHKLYPEIQLEIRLENHYLDLLEQEVDLALRVGPLADSSFLARKLAVFQYLLCASPDYLKHQGKPLLPEDLQHHRCLLTTSSRQAVKWEFEKADGQQTHVLLHSQFRCNHLALSQQLAREGLGITLLPDFMIRKDLAAGRLAPVMTDWRCVPRTLYAVYPRQHYTPQSVKLFVDYLQQNLNEGFER